MLNTVLAGYLLVVAPGLALRRSLMPQRDGQLRTPMSRYWSMCWPVLVMLGVLWIGWRQGHYTARDIGLDVPLSSAGAWGLGFAVLLMASLSVIGKIVERRHAPERRAENECKLLDAAFPWPRTGTEALVFAASTLLVTAGWEILYRGFILFLLTPGTGLPIAVAISSLAYGVAHGFKSSRQLIASIVCALGFTAPYAMTRSLWWLIVLHASLPLTAVPAALRAHRRSVTAAQSVIP